MTTQEDDITERLLCFDLDTGHELWTIDSKRGVKKAPFACTKVVILEQGDKLFVIGQLPGFFRPRETTNWLLGLEDNLLPPWVFKMWEEGKLP